MRRACPDCRENGKDASGDNLVLMPNGDWLCFRCKYREEGNTERMEKTATKARISLETIAELPVGTDPARKISAAIATKYDTRISYNGETGKIDKVYYPHYDGKVIITGKERTLPKTFSIYGQSDKMGMWGKWTVPAIPIHPLYITEGEEDALALAEIFTHSSKGAYVVSLPNGATMGDAVKRDIDFFKRFKEIVIVTDVDDPGKKIQTQLADFLVPLTKHVFTTKLPAKDASKCLTEGLIKEAGAAVTTGRKKYEPEGVLSGADIDILTLMEPTP